MGGRSSIKGTAKKRTSQITYLLSSLKHLLIPDLTCYRRVWFGVCRSCYLPINLRHHFRAMIGLYEVEISRFVKSYIRPGFCCYDIGAGHGYYTLAFGRLASPGIVYGIEGDGNLCDVLRETVSHNGHIKSAISVINLFIGGPGSTGEKKATIDDLVFKNGYSRPDLIKLDIEGDEYEALQGARRVIKQYSPKFIIEVHSEELEESCKSLLKAEGYQILIVNQNAVLPERRPISHNRWLCAEVDHGFSPQR